VVRWLGAQFLTEDEKRQVGIITADLRAEARAEIEGGSAGDAPEARAESAPASPPNGQTSLPLPPSQGGGYTFLQMDGAICGSCGWTMIRSGTCYKCENCGSTSGCS
jgi:ribonucleoside-diphosphate reductase alpha chain